MRRLALVGVLVATVLAPAAPAAADYDRVVRPGGTFKLARDALIVKVRINGGQVLRVRCVGDGCDWRRRRKPQILAAISELDRVFHSYAPRVSLRVTIRRR